ncbi:MAG: tRNA-binding protein [Candidatus Aenigmarchaeota archaeon]
MATVDNFLKLDIRVGRIISVKDFPEARKPSYKLRVDFGKYGIKRSSAQITKLYSKEDLMNRQVVAVTNFPPKKIADFKSEVLVLGVMLEDGKIVLLQPDRETPLGYKIA